MNSVANETLVARIKIFETVFSSPGMHESCKIVLSPSRQTILVLARLIENGIDKKGPKDADEIICILPESSLNDLRAISEELLRKGGLVEFYQHLKHL